MASTNPAPHSATGEKGQGAERRSLAKASLQTALKDQRTAGPDGGNRRLTQVLSDRVDVVKIYTVATEGDEKAITDFLDKYKMKEYINTWDPKYTR